MRTVLKAAVLLLAIGVSGTLSGATADLEVTLTMHGQSYVYVDELTFGVDDGWNTADGAPGIATGIYYFFDDPDGETPATDGDGDGLFYVYYDSQNLGVYDHGVDVRLTQVDSATWANYAGSGLGSQDVIRFHDADVSGTYTRQGGADPLYEDIWWEKGGNSQYDEGVDVRLVAGDDGAELGTDDQFDIPGPFSAPGAPSEAYFWEGTRLQKDVRPTPTTSGVTFELRVDPGDADFNRVAGPGIFYQDVNGNGTYDLDGDGGGPEPVWVDGAAGQMSIFDTGETVLVGNTPANGTRGIVEGLFFHDLSGDGAYTAGEEIWSNAADADGAYTATADKVYNGGDDTFDTPFDTVGSSVDLVSIWWDQSLFQGGGAGEDFIAEIRDSEDNVLADMSQTNHYEFTDFTQDTTTVTIVLRVGQLPPDPGADSAQVKISTQQLLDVLANDTDADGVEANMVLISLTGKAGQTGSSVTTALDGTATIDGNQVTYTAPATASTIDDPDTYDSFTYTVRDEQGLTAEGTVTVIVFGADVVVTRSHAARMKSGAVDGEPADDDAGLEVTITIDFLDPATVTKLELTEFFPLDDQGQKAYQVGLVDPENFIAADLNDGTKLRVAGDAPDTIAGNGGNSGVTFTWTSFPPNDPLTFTYILVGPRADGTNDTQDTKSFCNSANPPNCGEVVYNVGAGDVSALVTGNFEFLPVESLADVDVDDNGLVQTKDFILISRKINLVDPFGFDLLAAGMTLDGITEQQVLDNISALQSTGGADVDGNGSVQTKDFILISRKINLVDPFGFDLLAPGMTLDGITEQEVLDNITKVEPKE